jgi:LacI family transcriptional regulator
MSYFSEISDKKNVRYNLIEIDLTNPSEPRESLTKAFANDQKADGIFVPNSRAFKLAPFLEENNLKDNITIGYDLVDQNVEHLKKGNITYLISQKPEFQAYKAIMALFHYLTSRKEVNKTNYSAIDIIVKENIDYYI